MAFEPIQPSSSSVLPGKTNNNPLESSRLNKPISLQDQLNAKPKDDIEDAREKKNARDKLSLSQQAQEFLQRSISEVRYQDNKFTIDKAEDAAIEFKGLSQIASNRELTESETQKLNQIKASFETVGLGEKDINKIADRKIQQIAKDAPKLVQQLDEGNITGEQFSRLNSINEAINKVNGFGISEADKLQSDPTEVKATKDTLNSILDSSKDKTLPRNDLESASKLARDLGTIQGFQINVLKSVGSSGITV